MKKTLLAAPALVIIIFLLVCCRVLVFGGTEKRTDLQYRADIGVGEAAGLAMMAYAEHHGGRLPDARRWEEDIQPYWGGPFSVTMQSHSGDRMAMNSRLSGVKLDAIASPDTVVFYETHSSVKDAHGVLLWKQSHQIDVSTTREWRILVFADGRSCSSAEGSGFVMVPPGKPKN